MGKDVANFLFTNYIKESQKNAKGEHLSSHWENLLRKGEVIYEDGKIKKISGFGIGRIESRSILKSAPDWFLILFHLAFLSNRLDIIRLFPTAIKICKKLGISFDYAAFTQICAMSVISKYVNLNKRVRIINIGDGNGLLSSLLKVCFPHVQICLVDLGQILLFQYYHLQKLFPLLEHLLSKDNKKEYDLDNSDAFVYCPTEELEGLTGMNFDIGINVSSMQEMNQREREAFSIFEKSFKWKGNILLQQ